MKKVKVPIWKKGKVLRSLLIHKETFYFAKLHCQIRCGFYFLHYTWIQAKDWVSQVHLLLDLYVSRVTQEMRNYCVRVSHVKWNVSVSPDCEKLKKVQGPKVTFYPYRAHVFSDIVTSFNKRTVTWSTIVAPWQTQVFVLCTTNLPVECSPCPHSRLINW